jgi:hypothetical protein
MPFSTIADGELNREIGSQSDEQYHERSRNRIESADYEEAEGRRSRQTGEDGQNDRNNNSKRTQR